MDLITAGWLLAAQEANWPALIFPLVGTALGGLLAIVGGMIAERLRFRTEMTVRKQQAEWEMEQRRREKREETYVKITEIVYEVREVAFQAYLDYRRGRRRKARKRFDTETKRMYELARYVAMFAIPSVSLAMAELHKAFYHFHRLITHGPATVDEVEAAEGQIVAATQGLTRIMRSDLGY